MQGNFNGWSSWVVNNPYRAESNFSLNRTLPQMGQLITAISVSVPTFPDKLNEGFLLFQGIEPKIKSGGLTRSQYLPRNRGYWKREITMWEMSPGLAV